MQPLTDRFKTSNTNWLGESNTQRNQSNGQNTARQLDQNALKLQTPALNLPKGGGALRGIDESFQVNAVNASLSFAIPLPVAAGRGMAPSLTLSYSSGSGNSPFGIGWAITSGGIQRRTDKQLPTYRDDQDTFLLAGSEELVPTLLLRNNQWFAEELTSPTGEHIKNYRPRIESAFTRIERVTPANASHFFWRVTTATNIVTTYGQSANARLVNPANPEQIFEWLPQLSYDDKGNCMVFEYVAEDLNNVGRTLPEEHRFDGIAPFTNRYLKRVRYGNRIPYKFGENPYYPFIPGEETGFHFETVLDYGEHDSINPTPRHAQLPDGTPKQWPSRRDPFSTYRAGFDIRTYRRCERVLLFHRFDQLGSEPCLVRSLDLTYRDTDPANTTQPIEVSYLDKLTTIGYIRNANGQYTRKSLPPTTFRYAEPDWQTDIREVSRSAAPNAPQGLTGPYSWIDLDSEGLPGILTEQGNAWWFEANLGKGRFATARKISPIPSLLGLGQQVLLQELEANGQKALVSMQKGIAGFFDRTSDGNWTNFKAFEHFPEIDLTDPNLRLIDLSGDGKPDLLLTEDNAFIRYESDGKKGYKKALITHKPHDDEYGPALVFADSENSVFLADMTGDGLTDIVRIRNGAVCYWPNLGYGRFGAKVSMDNAPLFDRPGTFNPAYLRLADISGTGATDLLYLAGDQPSAWLNLSGNRFSLATPLPGLPSTSLPNQVDVLDLLGTGTACLVWSSPLPQNAHAPMRFVDLMNSRKPHLLIGYENNCGKTVSFTFQPSTQFYLADKLTGHSWATQLPFPVQCLANVRTEDSIRETVFVNSYHYRHGYYDTLDREFRGFGWVEQTDTEDFTHFRLNDARNVVEEDLHQPPVRSVSWFHTGAFFDRSRLLHQFAGEYFQNPVQAEHTLTEPPLPDNLSAEEAVEALRAYKSLPLRQEVYANDNHPNQAFPFSTRNSTYQIRCLQPRASNRHAVFQVVPAESISYGYERNPSDPRISQQVTLETNELGQPVRSVSVVYPRQQRPAAGASNAIPDAVWNEQNRRHIMYTEIYYTQSAFDDSPDIREAANYRLRVPYESRGYELSLPNNQHLFVNRTELLNQAANANSIDFETDFDGSPQKRLVAHSRIYFRSDDLQNRLPLGHLPRLGISYESYQLAFTAGLVARHYAGRVADTTALLTEHGYVNSENDAHWWIPSGVSLFAGNAADHFYLAQGIRDALGNESLVQHDDYDLLHVQTTDAIGNTVTVKNDYRTLSPWLMTDTNGNRTAVETDALGMVIKSAVMGKVDANEGDTLADPTTRMEYDLVQWQKHRLPNFVRTFSREQHGAANPRWQENVAYSDGGGTVIMVKTQAEPGLARRWDDNIQQVVEEPATARWVGNGRTILNNKGNPVKQYDPYFSTTSAYEPARALVETGPTALAFYDAAGRNIRTELPNGTLVRTEFDAWFSRQYDPNDTVRESRWYSQRHSPNLDDTEPDDPEIRAAWLTLQHADTPTTIHSDGLGRPMLSITDYGGGHTTQVRSEVDSSGRWSRMFDQLNREVAFGANNLVGMGIYGLSAEKGERRMLSNVLGNVVQVWEGNGNQLRNTYDPLHRPRYGYLTENGNETLISVAIYGDNHPEATAHNLRGQLCQLYDQAGLVLVDRLDFKGNPQTVSRRFTRDYQGLINWQPLEDIIDTNDVLAAAAPLLENETFSGSATFDAIGRPVRVELPDRSVFDPQYNEANGLASLRVQLRGQGAFVPFLQEQNYDAKGQRQFARFGNDLITRYFYDPLSFRLTRLLTTPGRGRANPEPIQDLRYTYDPAGNITTQLDRAQQTYFFRNNVVRPDSQFVYDATYQLVQATGREHAGLGQTNHTATPIISPLPSLNQPEAVRAYTQTYQYDDLGNLLHMRHSAGVGSWHRQYQYNYQTTPGDLTNRLQAISRSGDAEGVFSGNAFAYDAHGNLTRMPHLTGLVWNFMDQLREVDLGGGDRAYYVYGSSGQRLRKVIKRGGRRQERLYIGAVEVYREHQGEVGANPPRLERWTLHISDNTGRIARADTKTIDRDRADTANLLNVPVIRYQFSSHLGSATLETDDAGGILTYEEYHPFGTSSYRLARSPEGLSLKRHRYAGQECDDETGLYCMGVRYYAPWLGRWTSTDPAGFADGFNMYRYCVNNPVIKHDPTGTVAVGIGQPGDLPATATIGQLQVYALRHGYSFDDPNNNRQFEVVNSHTGAGIWVGGIYTPVSDQAQANRQADLLEIRETFEGIARTISPSPQDSFTSPSSTISGVSQNASQPATATFSHSSSDVTPSDSQRPSGHKNSLISQAAIEASASGAIRALDSTKKWSLIKQVLSLLEGAKNIDDFGRIARFASQSRQDLRAADQLRGGFLNRVISQYLDKNSGRSFMHFLSKNLNGRQGEEALVDAYESVAINSTKSNELADGLGAGGRIFGGILGGIGMYISGESLVENLSQGKWFDSFVDSTSFVSSGLAVGAAVSGSVALGEAGLVIGSFGIGVLIGSGIDKCMAWAGKSLFGIDLSPSNGIAYTLNKVDNLLSPLWADSSKPAYTQTLGWKLAN